MGFEPRTSLVRLYGVADKTLSYPVSADWNLKPGLLSSFIKSQSRILKSSEFRPPTQKPSKFRCSHYNQAPSKNQLNFDHPHKTKSIDHHNKTSQFRPAQSISTPRAKNKSISTRTLKSSQFDPHSKIMLIAKPRQKKTK